MNTDLEKFLNECESNQLHCCKNCVDQQDKIKLLAMVRLLTESDTEDILPYEKLNKIARGEA